MESRQFAKTLEKVQKISEQLHMVVRQKGICDQETIRISQLLDKEILILQKYKNSNLQNKTQGEKRFERVINNDMNIIKI